MLSEGVEMHGNTAVPEEILGKALEAESILGRVTGKLVKDLNPHARFMVLSELITAGHGPDEDDLLLPWVVEPANDSDVMILSWLGCSIREITLTKTFLQESYAGVLKRLWVGNGGETVGNAEQCIL